MHTDIDRPLFASPYHWSDSMRIQPDTTNRFPVLLLAPDLDDAVPLASRLEAEGFLIQIKENAYSALQALQRSFFFALIVIADLTDEDCLAALRALRRAATRSWMIVAAPSCDVHACMLVYRFGGDACIAWPAGADELIDRLHAFQACVRPVF